MKIYTDYNIIETVNSDNSEEETVEIIDDTSIDYELPFKDVG